MLWTGAGCRGHMWPLWVYVCTCCSEFLTINTAYDVFREWFKTVGLDIPGNVKIFDGI